MDYKDINDYEVLYMIKENDDDATLLLYDKYKPLIDKKIYKWNAILNKLNISIDDLKQELYLAFTKAVKTYNENNNALFYTYVNLILDGHIKNIIKSMSKKVILNSPIVYNEEEEELSLLDLIVDDTYNPSNNCDYNTLIKFCYEFSLELPFDQSIIFEMYISGYKIKDIANILNKKPNSVSVSINRILKKLKKELVKNEYLVI